LTIKGVELRTAIIGPALLPVFAGHFAHLLLYSPTALLSRSGALASPTCSWLLPAGWARGYDNFIVLQRCNIVIMSTTIQVQDDVYKMLNILKKELNVESYNDVVKHLLKKAKRMDESEFGSMPGIAPFKREEIDRFN
jgi:predicted CopG family antitoxin